MLETLRNAWFQHGLGRGEKFSEQFTIEQQYHDDGVGYDPDIVGAFDLDMDGWMNDYMNERRSK